MRLAETFNPTEFDPAAWARLAKLAGMEYVVFTAKHHDGFCMFDTAYSDFKITRTPLWQGHRGHDRRAPSARKGSLSGSIIRRVTSVTNDDGPAQRHLYEPDFAAAALFGPRSRRSSSITSAARSRSS